MCQQGKDEVAATKIPPRQKHDVATTTTIAAIIGRLRTASPYACPNVRTFTLKSACSNCTHAHVQIHRESMVKTT